MKPILWSDDIFESDIANNWSVLKRRIELEDFPPGHMVGRRRCWTAAEVIAWIETRPSENATPLRGRAKQLAAACAARSAPSTPLKGFVKTAKAEADARRAQRDHVAREDA